MDDEDEYDDEGPTNGNKDRDAGSGRRGGKPSRFGGDRTDRGGRGARRGRPVNSGQIFHFINCDFFKNNFELVTFP